MCPSSWGSYHSLITFSSTAFVNYHWLPTQINWIAPALRLKFCLKSFSASLLCLQVSPSIKLLFHLSKLHNLWILVWWAAVLVLVPDTTEFCPFKTPCWIRALPLTELDLPVCCQWIWPRSDQLSWPEDASNASSQDSNLRSLYESWFPDQFYDSSPGCLAFVNALELWGHWHLVSAKRTTFMVEKIHSTSL